MWLVHDESSLKSRRFQEDQMAILWDNKAY